MFTIKWKLRNERHNVRQISVYNSSAFKKSVRSFILSFSPSISLCVYINTEECVYSIYQNTCIYVYVCIMYVCVCVSMRISFSCFDAELIHSSTVSFFYVSCGIQTIFVILISIIFFFLHFSFPPHLKVRPCCLFGLCYTLNSQVSSVPSWSLV